MSEPLPQPPAHLGPLGAECWRQYVEDLARYGPLELFDLTVVEEAAELYEMKREAWDTLKAEGFETESDRREDASKAHPAVSLYKTCVREYRQHAKQIQKMKPDVDEVNIETGNDPVPGLPGGNN